jgi:hypothetical protein
MPSSTLKKRREKLAFTAAALARILDVDPATVFRTEKTDTSWLWYYALQGIEAELAQSRKLLREKPSQQLRLEPEFYHQKGLRAVGERMAELRAQFYARGLEFAELDKLNAFVIKKFVGPQLERQERKAIRKRIKARVGDQTVPEALDAIRSQLRKP